MTFRRFDILTFLLALAHALLFACSFPPVNLWFLAFVSPAPLAWLAVRASSTKAALLSVLAAQMGLWLWMNCWVVQVTLAGLPMMALILSLYTCLLVWIIRRISRHPRMKRWPMAIVVPLAWVGVECLRGELLFHGYPWYLLAHPLVEWPILAQSADLLGTYFISFLAAIVAGAAIDAARARARLYPIRAAIASIVLAAALNAANLAYGLWRIGQGGTLRPGPTILAIQTNLPQDNKIGWPLEEQLKDVPAFIDLTREAFEAAGGRADLIVWPETMLPVRGLELDTLQTLWEWGQEEEVGFAEAVVSLTRELERPMLVGSTCFLGLDVDENRRWTWEKQYNSAYLVDQALPEQRYDKLFLTPFGETMPYISAWPWLERKMLAFGAAGMSFALDSNPDVRLIRMDIDGSELTIATPICFEDTMARVCRRMVYADGRKRVDVIANLSNDGWFGFFDAGRTTHAQIARLRCIENRVPMVRCANTGLSVSIDSTGNIIGAVGEGRYGEPRRANWLEATVALDERTTLYGRIGDVWAWACLLLGAALTFWTFLGRRKG